MKLSAKLYALAVGASLMGLGACSDEDNNPAGGGNNNVNINVLVNTQGSYYVYDTQETDSSNQPISSTRSYDTTIVGGTQTFEGRTARQYTTTNSESGEKDTVYYNYNQDSSRLYAYEAIVGGITGLDNIIPGRRWVLKADFNASSSWKIFDTTMNNVPIMMDVSGDSIPESLLRRGAIKITAAKGGTANFTVNSQTKKAYEIVTTLTLNGTVGYLGFNLPVSITQNTHRFYVDGVGLVQTKMDPVKVPLSVLGTQVFNGEISTLTQLSIKQ